jgi:predicted dehydrogenase
MKTLRLGIIGMGGVGIHHATYITRDIAAVTLAAFSTRDPERLSKAKAQFPGAAAFTNHAELLASKTCDAVLIATPHYQHLPITQEALGAGMHVLVEKPLAVTVSAAQQIVHAAAGHPRLVTGIMLNQRTNPLYAKMREMVQGGKLGTLTRITWIATHWFRPDAYYRSSPWRATWKGEGGGVLINQAHHNLDLLCWITGRMPRTVTAVGARGKHHAIETEDEVSAILEYDDGTPTGRAVAHFLTTTGEGGGVNRLEIAGTKGRLVAEENTLTFYRLDTDAQEFSRTATEPFSAPQVTTEKIAVPPAVTPDHRAIVEDFARVIVEGQPSSALLAPASDAVHAVELGNAILMAALTRKPVTLPLDPAAYDTFLARLTASS